MDEVRGPMDGSPGRVDGSPGRVDGSPEGLDGSPEGLDRSPRAWTRCTGAWTGRPTALDIMKSAPSGGEVGRAPGSDSETGETRSTCANAITVVS